MTILSRFPEPGRLPRLLAVALLELACSSTTGAAGNHGGTTGSKGGTTGTAGTGGTAGSGGTGDGGTGGATGAGASGGNDAGSSTVTGRVLVVQQGGSSAPDLWTRAWFSWASACPGTPVGYPGCNCTDGTVGGCTSRTCTGRGGYYFVQSPSLLGYAPGDALLTTGDLLEAGTLAVRDGSNTFSHPSPYDAHDALASPWQMGDAVRISAAGATAPPFSIDVPFPPTVSFAQPDLSAGTVLLDSDMLDVRWTPAQGTGSVEATIVSGFQPDAGYDFTVIRCSADVSQGQLLVPVPAGGTRLTTPQSWRSFALRVINRGAVQAAGLTVDAIVASYDSGPINEAPPSSDSGAAD